MKNETKQESPNEIKLSDGRVAVIRDATGMDQVNASKMTKGDTGLYLYALMALCVTIDSEQTYIDTFTAMKLKDATTLTAAFSDINF